MAIETQQFFLASALFFLLVLVLVGAALYLVRRWLRQVCGEQGNLVAEYLDSRLRDQVTQAVAESGPAWEARLLEELPLSIAAELQRDEQRSPGVLTPIRLQPRPWGDAAPWSDEEAAAHEFAATRYGIGYGKIDVQCVIERDGSIRVIRQVIVEAYSEIESLDTFLVLRDLPDEVEDWDVDRIRIRSLRPLHTVTLRNPTSDGRKLSVELVISPQLTAGQSMEYELQERIAEPVIKLGISKTEQDERRDHGRFDYFGWTINRPTRHLTLRVYFPPEVEPAVYGNEVRYAPAAPGISSTRTHHVERQRLDSPSLEDCAGGRRCLTLEVPYPMVGLIYLLRWLPPLALSSPASREPASEGADQPATLAGEADESRPVTARQRQRTRMTDELRRLQDVYDDLSAEVRALDTDIVRTFDSAQKQALQARRQEALQARDQIAAQMAALEASLDEGGGDDS
ncbi:MAG: hypothetical protein ACK2U9_01015 [Anaerolineae bacterium]